MRRSRFAVRVQSLARAMHTDAPVIGRRVVIEFTSQNGARQMWVPPVERITAVDGSDFIALSFSGDRGFARFCDANMKVSNPLVEYTWLDEARKLRNVMVDAELDRLACEMLCNHTQGAPVAHRHKFENAMPKTVTIDVPPIPVDGGEITLQGMKVLADLNPSKALSVSCAPDVLHYIRFAMLASKGSKGAGITVRARPKHEERLSATTGVAGVHRHGRGRVVSRFKDDDGMQRSVTKTLPVAENDPDGGVTSHLCKKLRVSEPALPSEGDEMGDAAALGSCDALGVHEDEPSHVQVAMSAESHVKDATQSLSDGWQNVFRTRS